MALRKPSGSNVRNDGPKRPVDPGSEADLPTLLAYLVDDCWEDGTPRQRSSLIVFSEDELFKCCLTDKDHDMTLWVASRTLVDLFAGLEARLCDPDVEWRKRKGPGTGPRKKG